MANNAVTIDQPLDVTVPEEHNAGTTSAIEQRRRRHILRVVATVVAEEGFTGATMRKIAERAGVSTGMLTYYYKNKREILQEMLADTYTRLITSLSELVGDDLGPERGRLTTPILSRRDLATPRTGPCIVEEYDATCVIPPDAHARLDDYGNIVIEVTP